MEIVLALYGIYVAVGWIDLIIKQIEQISIDKQREEWYN